MKITKAQLDSMTPKARRMMVYEILDRHTNLQQELQARIASFEPGTDAPGKAEDISRLSAKQYIRAKCDAWRVASGLLTAAGRLMERSIVAHAAQVPPMPELVLLGGVCCGAQVSSLAELELLHGVCAAAECAQRRPAPK